MSNAILPLTKGFDFGRIVSVDVLHHHSAVATLFCNKAGDESHRPTPIDFDAGTNAFLGQHHVDADWTSVVETAQARCPPSPYLLEILQRNVLCQPRELLSLGRHPIPQVRSSLVGVEEGQASILNSALSIEPELKAKSVTLCRNCSTTTLPCAFRMRLAQAFRPSPSLSLAGRGVVTSVPPMSLWLSAPLPTRERLGEGPIGPGTFLIPLPLLLHGDFSKASPYAFAVSSASSMLRQRTELPAKCPSRGNSLRSSCKRDTAVCLWESCLICSNSFREGKSDS